MLINKQNKISTLNKNRENYKYKVSIIVPCYNTKPWLDECLQSLVDQTLQEIEIICINDGSTDGTGERLDEWQAQYLDKIKVIHQQNSGLSNARNAGMKIAQGECVGFVDSDDFVDVTMYEKLYNILINNNVDIVRCDFIKFIEKTKITKKISVTFKKEATLDFIDNNYAWLSIYKQNFLKRNSISFLKDIHYMEDLAFAYDIALTSFTILTIESKLYYYRQQRKGQLTLSIDKKIFDIYNIFAYLESKNMNYLLKQKLLQRKISLIKSGFIHITLKHKFFFLCRAADCLFKNHKLKDIYRNIFSKKYVHKINYLLSPSFFILLNIWFFIQKTSFLKRKKYSNIN